MVKAVTAAQMGFVLGLALFGASMLILPGFAPEVEAREASISTKSDRLDVQKASAATSAAVARIASIDCTQEVWPALPASCLKGASGQAIAAARFVAAKR